MIREKRAQTASQRAIHYCTLCFRGILPALLEEVISTRIMVKESIKLLKTSRKKGDTKLLRLLNHRQFGLKMFANVTSVLPARFCLVNIKWMLFFSHSSVAWHGRHDSLEPCRHWIVSPFVLSQLWLHNGYIQWADALL